MARRKGDLSSVGEAWRRQNMEERRGDARPISDEEKEERVPRKLRTPRALARAGVMQTMVRRVQDDFYALLMCNAIESAGGRPFAVVFVPEHAPHGPSFPHLRIGAAWHVFGQVEESRIDEVDREFQRLSEAPVGAREVE